MISRVRSRVILAFASFFLLALMVNSFAKSSPPALSDVLKKSGPSFDWGTLFFGFFALSLGTLSLAKAYDVFKKSNDKKSEPKSAFSDAEIMNLRIKIDDVSSSLKFKNEENEELKGQISEFKESLKEKLNGEELLKKGISSLRKECEKLVAEKEKLNLELSRKNWEDLFGKRESVVEFTPMPIVEETMGGAQTSRRPRVKKNKMKAKASPKRKRRVK